MTTHDTTGPARNYPLPQPEHDPRFTFGLLYEVAKTIEAHGYPPFTGRDLVELGQALFRLLYAPDPETGAEPVHLGDLVDGDWAVTCPACVGQMPSRRGPQPAPDEADELAALDADPSDYAAIERGARIDAAVEATGHLPGHFDADGTAEQTRWLEPSLGPCPRCPCPTEVHNRELGCVLCGCAWGPEARR